MKSVFLFTVVAILLTESQGQKKSTGPVDLYNYKFFTDNLPVNIKKKVNKALDRTKQFSFRGNRPGNAVDTHACGRVTAVPRHLNFITRYNHYQKYTHAYGIPIVSTNRVSNAGLNRACYVVRFLLADRPRLRQSLYKNYGRLGIMAENEGTTTIPEHRHLGSWWDTRARGLGGTLSIPISTGGEENLLCRSSDRYRREDIFLHEFSHGISEVAIRGGGIPGYFARLQRAYNSAKYRGLWRNTYAMSTVQEYFAEGVQSYFEVNDYAARPNGVHGPVNTRSKLRNYDITLYNLVREVFPCGNIIHDRCKRGTPPSFRMNCDGSKPVVTVAPPKVTTTTTTQSTKKPDGGNKDCVDKNKSCGGWARYGYCKSNAYVKTNCKKSCKSCDNSSCKDNNKWCNSWNGKGYCNSNSQHYNYMIKNCKKACSLC